MKYEAEEPVHSSAEGFQGEQKPKNVQHLHRHFQGILGSTLNF